MEAITNKNLSISQNIEILTLVLLDITGINILFVVIQIFIQLQII